MKTIFIPIFQGQVARNIFQTQIISFLTEYKDFNFIFIAPPEKVNYYSKNYGQCNVSFIPYKLPDFIISVPERIIRGLMFYSVYNATKFINLKIDYDRQRGLKAFLRYTGWYVYLVLLARINFVKKILRYLFLHIAIPNTDLINLLKRKQVDLLYIPNIYDSHSVEFIKAARHIGIRVITTVNSWDNLSTRGLIPIVPDRLLVQNEYMQEEAIRDHLIDNKLIFVCGIPQFDYYFNFKPTEKKDFYIQLGINDIDKKIILFAPPPLKFKNSYWEVLKKLDQKIDSAPFFNDFVILVRFYPNDIVNIESFKVEHGLQGCKHVFYSLPCTNYFSGGVNWEFNREDMKLLADSIYYSSLIINYGSTMNIDAAAFNKPSINISFEEDFGLGWAYNKTHIIELLKTGGTRIVKNYDELEYWLFRYLSDFNLDHSKRKEICHRFCYKLDGLSSRRLVDGIISLIL